MLTNPANTRVPKCLQVEVTLWNMTDRRGQEGGIDRYFLIVGSDDWEEKIDRVSGFV